MMKILYIRAKNTLFSDSLGFRAHIFNTLGLLGFALGFGLGLYYIFNFSGIGNIIGNFSAAALAVIFISAANYTKAFKWFFLFTVILLFLIIFPYLFFAGGGYHSSMPCFFVFAVVFTVIMLEGRQRTIFTLLEFALYLGCFLTAWYHPETVVPFPTEADIVRDIVIGCMASAAVLAIAIHRHIVIYDRNMKELERANEALQGLNRMKSEFLQDMSHEMQNPLSVISVGTDFIHYSMDKEGGAEDAHQALNTVQNEAMRLGRMVNGMVSMAAMSGDLQSREKLDFTALLTGCAETARLSREKKQNTLRVEIASNLPYVHAEADRLRQAVANLLDNAARHTRGGEIVLEAHLSGGYISVRVRDTGVGIAPSLLPRVFERGVSGSGGSGYGLSISKTIVEAHGGTIGIASEPGKGTAVTFTIPVYGGQNEAREYGK